MNIVLLANNDIASNYAINHLLHGLTMHKVTIFLSASVGAASRSQQDTTPQGLRDLRFFEQHLFNDIVFPLLPLDSPSTLKSFAQIGQLLGKPVEHIVSINDAVGVAKLSQVQPDLIISIRFGLILKAEAIATAKHGVINLHSGKLPDYKGVMATFRGMLNGERELGTTLHYISDSQIDAGAILGTTSLPVDKRRSYLWHVLQLYPAGCELILAFITALEDGRQVPAFAQVDGGAYYTFPTEQELGDFYRKGYRLYDGDEIVNLVKDYTLSALPNL